MLCAAALLLASAATAQAQTELPSLEQRIDTIERTNQTAPWQESAALIEALGAERTRLVDPLRYRVELVEARNLALAGDYAGGLALAESMLAREIAPDLRLRALTLAVNMTTNVSDYPRAFAWMQEGLTLLEQTETPQPRLLGMASYLYLRVGEEGLALDYAQQALEVARSAGTPRDLCVALSDYAIALDEIGHTAQAESTSREQIEACNRAADPVFVADGHKGVGKALLAQSLYVQAIPWLTEAREQFGQAGFNGGYLETGVSLAMALLHSNGSLARARALIEEAIPTFDAQQAHSNIEKARLLMSEILDREGRPAEALAQLRLAQAAHNSLEDSARERRLGYLQMKFDSEAKEQRIALLQGERAIQAAEIAARSRTQWLQGLGLMCLFLVTALLISLLLRTISDRRRYRELSERDGLTGLYNHQSTLRLGRLLQARSRREQRPFTAIVADIDCFKQINDNFGHAAGDAVLRNLGQLLLDVFPAQAIVGRSGGEEFTMLIDASIDQARYLIEELRRRTSSLIVLDQRLEYSLSYGLCEATQSQASLEEILRSADMALYQAKRSGRNRVVDAADLPLTRKLREAGFAAPVTPQISPDTGLYADLGINPVRSCVQSIHATQFLLEDRQIDSRTFLLLWQVALTGDSASARFDADPKKLQHLVDRLLLDYPADHEVTLYEATRLPIEPFRAHRLMLRDLASARHEEWTTLVIPPCPQRHPDFAAQFLESLRSVGK